MKRSEDAAQRTGSCSPQGPGHHFICLQVHCMLQLDSLYAAAARHFGFAARYMEEAARRRRARASEDGGDRDPELGDGDNGGGDSLCGGLLEAICGGDDGGGGDDSDDVLVSLVRLLFGMCLTGDSDPGEVPCISSIRSSFLCFLPFSSEFRIRSLIRSFTGQQHRQPLLRALLPRSRRHATVLPLHCVAPPRRPRQRRLDLVPDRIWLGDHCGHSGGISEGAFFSLLYFLMPALPTLCHQHLWGR